MKSIFLALEIYANDDEIQQVMKQMDIDGKVCISCLNLNLRNCIF